MLFKNENLNTTKYALGMIKKPNEIYSAWDLCKELTEYSERIIDCLDEGNSVCTGVSSREYVLNASDIKCEEIRLRTHRDVYIQIFKKGLSTKLSLMGIIEPEDKESQDYFDYLQLVYFFYMMDQFIFPKEKFIDLFINEKLYSVENLLDSDTGNAKYERFILDNLCEVKRYNDILVNSEKRFDQVRSIFQSTLFGYYELEYYRYIRAEEVSSEKLYQYIQDSFTEKVSQEFNESFNNRFELLSENSKNQIQLSINKTNPVETFSDFRIKRITKTLFKDLNENFRLSLFDVYFDSSYANIPEKIKRYIVDYDEIDNFLNDDYLISYVMGEKITGTVRKKYSLMPINELIKGIWNLEKDEIAEYGKEEGTFSFLQQDEEGPFMFAEHIALIAKIFVNMKQSKAYYTKRTYMGNRSDGSKKILHSFKRSFRNLTIDGLNEYNSSFRNWLLRGICRAGELFRKNKNANEYLYYEVPMNFLNARVLLKLLDFDTTEQCIEFFEIMIRVMRERIDCLNVEHYR